MAKFKAKWLTSEATRSVFELLDGAGHKVFAVGGCVRNALIDMPVRDIDLSTNALPERVLSLAKSAGFNAVPTGIDHGTVTVFSGGQPFEVTTFRRDVETDGRRAVVAFSEHMEDDARRRDFTMNALYADRHGNVYDPLGGLSDLAARRVRFIEDPVQRIREDYLRSLRYFRFHAWYGDQSEGFDPDALDAIARNVEGLSSLSKERIGSEVKRLLEAPEPSTALAGMRSTGVLAAVLPGADDGALGPLIHNEQLADAAPNAIRRLAVIGGENPVDDMRLSKKETRMLQDLKAGASMSPSEAGFRLGAERGSDAVMVLASATGSAFDPKVLSDVERGAAQIFPLSAADLMPMLEGAALGAALKLLKTKWIASDFALSKGELIAQL